MDIAEIILELDKLRERVSVLEQKSITASDLLEIAKAVNEELTKGVTDAR